MADIEVCSILLKHDMDLKAISHRYKGNEYMNIRAFRLSPSGGWRHTTNGLVISPADLPKLKLLVDFLVDGDKDQVAQPTKEKGCSAGDCPCGKEKNCSREST